MILRRQICKVFLVKKRKEYMQLNNLRDVLEHEIEDLYSAETQLIEALPKMAEQAYSSDLKAGFEEHLLQTENQAVRLEEIAAELDVELPGATCKAMEGLIKEASELLKLDSSPAGDAALIASAQRIEHYEIAAYGSSVRFAKTLEMTEVADQLNETLKEEEDTDKKLTKIAEEEVNEKAV